MTGVDLGLDHPAPHRRLPTPTCLATACEAAVNVGYSPRCSETRRTALAFSSGSIFFGMRLILLDSTGAASNRGRFMVLSVPKVAITFL